MACQICRSKSISFKISIKDYEYNPSYSVEYKTCNNCNAIYRNKLKKTNARKLYTKEYMPISGGFIYDFLKKLNASYEWRIIRRLNFDKFTNKGLKLKILDIACGKGFLIKKISKNSNLVCIGIDINQNTKKKNNLSYFKKSFSEFSFIRNVNPDYIILNNFIEHIEDLNDFKNFINTLKKKVYLIIITPDSSGRSKKIFGKYWSGYHSPRHVNIFNKKSMKLLLKKNNLEYTIKSMFDPLSTLSSLKNCVTDLKHSFSFKKSYKLISFLIYSFSDFIYKNRMIIVCRKK